MGIFDALFLFFIGGEKNFLKADHMGEVCLKYATRRNSLGKFWLQIIENISSDQFLGGILTGAIVFSIASVKLFQSTVLYTSKVSFISSPLSLV